jgi:hypothetical protein
MSGTIDKAYAVLQDGKAASIPTDAEPPPALVAQSGDADPGCFPNVAYNGWSRRKTAITGLLLIGAVAALLVARAAFRRAISNTEHPSFAAGQALESAARIPGGEEIRILAGYSGPAFVDSFGRTWLGDRYYDGGRPYKAPDLAVRGTLDPEMYQTAREGNFRYDIPLKPGVYELHLHFAEQVYGLSNPMLGGDGDRVFGVRANGERLLSGFDLVMDAGGPALADERVFTDISPAEDGRLHLQFAGVRSGAILTGIDLLPGLHGKMRPVRILAGGSFHTDKRGQVWGPDRYFRGGRISRHRRGIQGTQEPGLYATERSGNLTYSIPVANGTYTVTLRFSENYFGQGKVEHEDLGRRVFDVHCNGIALLQNFDILREAGAGSRAVDRSFRRLKPNAQGKLIISFVPVIDYPVLNAIEVVSQ